MGALVGDIVRTEEWNVVRDFVACVRSRPAGLALVGEAGSGKSVLWRAGVEAAAEAGHCVLRSEPTANEDDLAFAALFDLLAEILPLVAANMPAPQREALEVALLLRTAGEEPPTSHAVGLAVLAVLRSCAADGPVLLAIDDVQWLDDASRDALTFAVRRLNEGPVSLLVAARHEAATDPLSVGAPPHSGRWRDLLSAMPGSENIHLRPLDPVQIRRLLPEVITPRQARLVAQQSGGNPFWAKEIATSIESVEFPFPPVAGALRQRLARSLSADVAAGQTFQLGRPARRPTSRREPIGKSRGTREQRGNLGHRRESHDCSRSALRRAATGALSLERTSAGTRP